MKKTLLSQSVEETQRIGQKIGGKLKGGEIIFLSGILGAGKTELIRGIAKGLGIKSKITSPTFNIMRVYDIPRGGKLHHFDCYRLQKYQDLVELGWEEILDDPGAITVLEWPECITDKDITKLPDKKITKAEIKIDNNQRAIILG